MRPRRPGLEATRPGRPAPGTGPGLGYPPAERKGATVYVVGSLVFILLAVLVVVSFVSMRRRNRRYEEE